MTHRRLAVPVLVAAFWAMACRGDPPPPPAPPVEEVVEMPDTAGQGERARQDSIRRAEEARAAARATAVASLSEAVYFDYDMSEIRPDAQQVLREKVEILRASPDVQMRIEGHADERGSTEYNLALGQRRAESVRLFLTDFGLNASRFSIVSYGEERPAVNQSNETAWARNRRAEFVVTAGEVNPPGED
jgi:peptidoglycan-associated lipoprotein